jgi:mannose-1-phosphate guanylyltransferase
LITKAFLLAAGLGTRLRPITDTIPKCLVPISGKPLLGWWIDSMEKYGIEEVLINTHYLGPLVEEFLNKYPTKIQFRIFYEERLLGSAGTIRENKKFIENEENFYIFYADNLTNFNLSAFAEFHVDKKKPLSMALFTSEHPTECGIAELNNNDIITSFEEKPQVPKSNLANAGLYVSKPEILDLIPKFAVADIGFHLLPKLIGNMAGWKSVDYLIDVGTLENLDKAERQWTNIMKGRL